MAKLLICIVCAAALGAGMLLLRQQSRELGFATAQLHREIKTLQITLWNQQLQIAVATAPNAIERTVGMHELGLIQAIVGEELGDDE
jgi:hypothetical protein